MRRLDFLLLATVLVLLAVVANPPPLLGELLGRWIPTTEAMPQASLPVKPISTATPTIVSLAAMATSEPTMTAEALEGHSGLKSNDTVARSPAAPEATAAAEKPRLLPGIRAPKAPRAAVELPRRIRIPAIGVEAGFEYVGLTEKGAMDTPKDPNKVAWYRLAPRPGEPGNAIVAGHVDWGGKTAVFWRLDELKAGDVVQVVAVDERVYEFVVQRQWWYDAETAPVAEIFAQSDATEITLITCGGMFDRKTGQYLSRLVVRAALR